MISSFSIIRGSIDIKRCVALFYIKSRSKIIKRCDALIYNFARSN